MPIQELLLQVLAEHEALQSKYNEALAEISLLHAHLADVCTPDVSVTKGVGEDVEAAPFKFEFLCEPAHGTLDSGAAVMESETDTDPTQTSQISAQKKKQRATVTQSSEDYFQVLGDSHRTSDEFLTGNACRDNLIILLRNTVVELFFVLVVFTNVVVLWLETDRRAAKLPKAVWSDIVNVVYLVIYLSEFMMRVIAYGTHIFDDKWNILDFAVIAIDILSIFMQEVFGSSISGGVNASTFRLLRLFRLIRVFTIFRFIPELQLLIHGFFGAMKAVFFATMMLFVVMLLWSFIFVEAIHPQVRELTLSGKFDDCLRCQRSYATMWDSHMTILQQIVAGDSWGMVTLDVIFAHPETSILFAGCLLSIQFGVLNLIFTVIVDAAMRAREEDQMLKLAEKEKRFQKVKEKLSILCESLDEDGSGDVTLEELIEGYQTNKAFAETMASLDISRDDIGVLFMIMDEDRSGRVTRVEFVNNIYKMKERDMHTMVMFQQAHIQDLRIKMKDEVIFPLTEMMSHVEAVMRHLEVQRNVPYVKAELNKVLEEGSSKFEAATEKYLKVKELGRESWA